MTIHKLRTFAAATAAIILLLCPKTQAEGSVAEMDKSKTAIQDAAKVLTSALKKSRARKAYRFEQKSKWSRSAGAGKMASVIKCSFDLSDKTRYAVKRAANTENPVFLVTAKPDAKKDLIVRILNAEHGSLGDSVARKDTNWKGAILVWTVELDAKTGLIRKIERGLALDAASRRWLLPGSHSPMESKTITLTIEYDDSIRVDVPKEVSRLAKKKQ